MADYALIQEKIYTGYGKAAKRLGQVFNHYRPASAFDPVSAPFLIGTILMSSNTSWSYMKYDGYGGAARNLVIDGNKTQPFDYLVGEKETFFIAAMQPIVPIMGVMVDSTISITRATQSNDVGYGGYSGHTDITDVTIMQNIPVSLLNGSRGSKNPVDLPTDTKMPMYQLLMPFLDDVIVTNGDFVIDQNGTRYVISAHELTELGWRLGVVEVGA